MSEPLDLLREAVRAFEARDRERTASLLRQLDAQAPDIGANWGPASRLAATIGEVELAIAAGKRAVAYNPEAPEQRLAYGALLASLGRIEEALKVTSWFVERSPPNAGLELFVGTLHAQLGQTGPAMKHLRQAAALPSSPELQGAAWLAIADLKTFKLPDYDVLTLEGLARNSGSGAPSTVRYALGKAYDDVGEVKKAFESYSAGARTVRGQRPFDAAASRAFVDDVVGRSTAERLARLPASRATDDRPIFVLGLPRSGTTLVEQMLASHSEVVGGGEINLFRTASMALEGYAPEEVEAHAANSPDAFTRIGEQYLHLLRERFPTGGRVVDKTLNHTRFLGLIHHALPSARFVWIRRDPADTALSCFRTHFAGGLGWSFDLADIGRHFADEDRLHAHWAAQFPDAVLTVPYEDLVAEPEAWARRILAHVGLAYEPAVLAFHTTARAVTTTSARQVREPLYSRSVGGWRRYADFMGPFFEAYGAAVA